MTGARTGVEREVGDELLQLIVSVLPLKFISDRI